MQAYCIFQSHDVILLTATMFTIGLQDKLHSVLSCTPCPSSTASIKHLCTAYDMRMPKRALCPTTLSKHCYKHLMKTVPNTFSNTCRTY